MKEERNRGTKEGNKERRERNTNITRVRTKRGRRMNIRRGGRGKEREEDGGVGENGDEGED